MDVNLILNDAIRRGDLTRVKELIDDFGISYSIGGSNDGYVSLCEALKGNHPDIAKLLLSVGAKVNKNGEQEWRTPLYYATQYNNEEMVQLLLEKGADPNRFVYNSEYSLLYHTVSTGNLSMSEVLLNYGAHVNLRSLGATPIYKATLRNDLQMIKLLVKYKADVNLTEASCDYTPLFLATEKNYLDAVKLLLLNRANVDFVCENRSVLYIAVGNGYASIVVEILKYSPDTGSKINKSCLKVAVRGSGSDFKNIIDNLLDYGFDVNPEDVNDWEFLFTAVKNGFPKIVEKFLNFGVNVNILNCEAYYRLILNLVTLLPDHLEGYAPLHIAIFSKNVEMIKFLLNNNADIDVLSQGHGFTPLSIATTNCYEDIVELLLHHGANVNAECDKETVLCIAAKKGYITIVKKILKYNPDISTEVNKSCLKIAVQSSGSSFKTIVDILLGYGFTVNPEDLHDLEFLFAAVRNNYLQIVDSFLTLGFDMNKIHNRQGYYLLHSAVISRHEIMIKLLLNYGADVNIKDNSGKNPLFFAAQNGDLEVFKLLLTAGANIKQNFFLLHAAVRSGSTKIVEILFKYNVDVNVGDESQRTALHLAAKVEKDRCHGFNQITTTTTKCIIKALVEKGADINAQDDEHGFTPLHYAVYHGREKIVQLLLGYNANIYITDKSHETALQKINLVRDRSTQNDLNDMFARHELLLVVANLCTSNKSLVQNHPLRDFQEQCEIEVAKMKTVMISYKASLYDILKGNRQQVLAVLKIQSVMDVATNFDAYYSEFPVYATMIDYNFKKGLLRWNLLKKIQSSNLYPFCMLPYLCTEMIFLHLDNRDLQNLVNAYVIHN